MDYPKKIRLSCGTILHIREALVTCTDGNEKEVELTRGQQKLIAKLAHNLNHPVSMADLYEAYAGEAPRVDDRGVGDNIAKMKNTLPKCVKESVKSVRGFGYQLLGTEVTEQAAEPVVTGDKTVGKAADLAGDFFGFYLDPLATGNVLAAYIHIENAGTREEPELAAYGVMGIRNEKVLLSEALPGIFRQPQLSYKEAFKEFRQTLNDNDRRCTWCRGTVEMDGETALIRLSSKKSGARWTVILDLSGYTQCRRERETERDHYRGGLGLIFAAGSLVGTYCARFGIVRTMFIHDTLILNHDEMKDRLKVLDDSKDALWKPLKLSSMLDKLWYNWFMND